MLSVREAGDELAALRHQLKIAPEAGPIRLDGAEPVGVHPFRLGTAGAVAAGLQASAVNELWMRRVGHAQQISVSIPRALQTLHQAAHTRQNGRLVFASPVVGGDTVPDLYPTADGRWCCLVLPQNTRRHQIERTMEVLGVGSRRQAPQAVLRWDAEELEEAIVANGAVAGGSAPPPSGPRTPRVVAFDAPVGRARSARRRGTRAAGTGQPAARGSARA